MAGNHRRVYVFSHPRSCSHLFYHILSGHPAFQATKPLTCVSAYFHGIDSQAPSCHQSRNLESPEGEAGAKVSWQITLNELQSGVADAETKGKWFLTTDHSHHLMSSTVINAQLPAGRESQPVPVVQDEMLDISTRTIIPEIFQDLLALAAHANPTLLPDRFFFSFTPIILIRHPARVIPSYLRVQRRQGYEGFGDLSVAASFTWERMVFDSFRSYEESLARAEGRSVNMPIVVDGGKFVDDPRSQMKKLCDVLRLDEAQIRYTWDQPGLTRNTPAAAAFEGIFSHSTGISSNPNPEKPLNLEEEMEGWVKEWDEPTARIIAEKVKNAMDVYEYLLQF
ncbi:hypothetical protein V5O48_009631, partial [Marasmius crinis-equi]